MPERKNLGEFLRLLLEQVVDRGWPTGSKTLEEIKNAMEKYAAAGGPNQKRTAQLVTGVKLMGCGF